MPKTTLLHIVWGINFGGVEQFLLNYHSHMDNSSYALHIVAFDPINETCASQFRQLGFTVHHVTPKHESLLRYYHELSHLLHTINPDIVHCHLTTSNYAPLFISKLHKVKHRISHAHQSYPTKTISQRVRCLLTKAFCTQRAACEKTAAKFLYGNLHNVYIIPNAIMVTKFHYDHSERSRVRKTLNITQNQILYGHIGRFEEQKNHLFLLKIFAILHQKQPQSKLLLVGDGQLRAKIHKQVSNYKLKDAVFFINPRSNISKYYQAMDAFLLPSLYEGLGIVLIEAQAAGLPCFVSDAIPREAQLTDLVTFMSLQQSPMIWANTVLTTKPLNNRTIYNNQVQNSKYNITAAYKILQKFYQEILCR